MWPLLVAVARAAPLRLAATDGEITFAAHATLHDFVGRATAFSGTYDPATGRGALVVEAASLTTGVGARDARMLAWCLDVQQYRTVRLTVTATRGTLPRSRDAEARVTLAGLLQIRDHSAPVSLAVDTRREGEALRLVGTLPLRTDDWGIPDPSILISHMDPEVVVRFDVLARPPDDDGPG